MRSNISLRNHNRPDSRLFREYLTEEEQDYIFGDLPLNKFTEPFKKGRVYIEKRYSTEHFANLKSEGTDKYECTIRIVSAVTDISSRFMASQFSVNPFNERANLWLLINFTETGYDKDTSLKFDEFGNIIHKDNVSYHKRVEYRLKPYRRS